MGDWKFKCYFELETLIVLLEVNCFSMYVKILIYFALFNWLLCKGTISSPSEIVKEVAKIVPFMCVIYYIRDCSFWPPSMFSLENRFILSSVYSLL